MRRTLLAICVAIVSAALLVAAPAAASAATLYPPVDACTTGSDDFSPGSTVGFDCEAGTFTPGERITITVTGERGDQVTFATVRTDITTASVVRTADADGALGTLEIVLPDDARGVYNIAAVSPTSAGGTASAVIDTSAEGVLPISGFDGNQLLGLWVGGGALVFAGLVVVGAAAYRRHRDATDD
ncbi:cell wall protein [Microbacterium dauci]|uniref:Cell wall protein n=1 Tax=Microbacterium dauci TaxID=3048008 RepID=A0ABT6ZFD3_9MICO|nr:cell wall protein [Microbacterium sp. LX3-4]MDJ1114435.1 cell wall protein [Microbacterium sp. LX3-4]